MSDMSPAPSARKVNTWEKNLLGVTIDKVASLLSGLLVAALLVWFCIWLSKYVGVTPLRFDTNPISAVVLAILLGLILGALLPCPSCSSPVSLSP